MPETNKEWRRKRKSKHSYSSWVRPLLLLVLLAAAVLAVLQWPFLERRFWIYPRTERALAALESGRTPRLREDSLIDLRGVLHAHSYLSHDSMGRPAEMIHGARRAGIDFVFMTDHFREPNDRKAIEQGLVGEHGGILFIPGVETSAGLIAWFLEKVPLDGRLPLAEQVAAVRAGEGTAFICHPDEPRPWDTLPPFTGMEIYNLHADAKKAKLTLYYRLSQYFWSMDRYPMQVYHSLFHDPGEYLAIWDRLTQTRQVVGIAGNDAHQNNGLRLIVSRQGTVILTDTGPKESPLIELRNLLARKWAAGKAPGTTLWRWDADLYERSYHFANTHLLARSKTVPALREALEAGHAYVAFDSLVTASGFAFSYRGGNARAVMGDQVEFVPGAQLQVYAPVDCLLRLIRNGRPVADERGRSLRFVVDQPGVYRVEAYLEVRGDAIPWIYSNPIYVRGQ